MWIDPLEVSYRIGENGSICVLYEYKEGVNEPWKPNVSIGCSAADKAAAEKRRKESKARAFSNSSTSSSAASSSASSTGSVSPPPQPTAPTNNAAATTKSAAAAAATTVPCKDSLRKMDYLLDPRKSVSIEQLAAYVSS